MMSLESLTWAFQTEVLNFEFVRDFIKTNILTKFHDYLTENVASTTYTRFF